MEGVRDFVMKTFLILLDALRHDYVTNEGTPFLYSLKMQGTRANVIETFAFQTRPSYFAGLEPEESGICHLFRYDPENSPFSFLSPFCSLLEVIERFGFDRYFRGIIRRMAVSRLMKLGCVAAAEVISTEKIPLHLLPNFTLAELRHTDSPFPYGTHPTIFDELREGGKTWFWAGYPRHFGSTENILKVYQSAPESDVYYLHFSELDWIGHKSGPESKEIQESLRKLDNILKVLLGEELRSNKARMVIFGDHGMAKVRYQINIEEHVSKLPYRNGVEYLLFLDSTQARFWFFDDDARRDICVLLSSIDGGHILTEQEREELRIRFKDRSYGDLIYMLDGPGIIHPSYFARAGAGPKGMHGYLPDITENMSQIFAVGPGVPADDLGTIPMREIFSIIKRTIFSDGEKNSGF